MEELRSRFPGSQVVGDVTQLPKHGNLKYIAVGPVALQSLLTREVNDPIFTLLVPRLTYRDILETVGKGRSSNVTAIFADASPEAQMQLVQRLFKRETRIAVLFSNKTASLHGVLRQAADKVGLRIDFIPVGEYGLNRALNQAGDASAILAIADDTIYNTDNIRTILLTTYQRGQPVVGFSTSLVKAGALGTTYSTVEDMVAQVGELIQDYAASGRVSPPQYPKYFGVLINDSVSRSLDVVVDEQVRKFGRKPVDAK